MTQPAFYPNRSRSILPWAVVGVALTVVLWAYWTTVEEISQRWAHDPQYSHGYLVPGFALVLLWLRRRKLAEGQIGPSWWGAPLLAMGLGLRLVAAYFHYPWFDAISLLPCLAGLCLMLGGRVAFRWAWPAIGFLGFMIPLPHRLSVALAGPLQSLATVMSTFALQTLGFPALAEGNVILLNEVELGIVEACSGLRMLVVFFAFSTAVALLIRRPLWEKLFIVVSAVPIALIVNVVRITATGILHETVGSEMADAFFHDLAGWLMMPLALGFLWLECTILRLLLVEPRTPTQRRMHPPELPAAQLTLGSRRKRRRYRPQPQPQPEEEMVEAPSAGAL